MTAMGRLATALGFDPRKTYRFFRGLPNFYHQRRTLMDMLKSVDGDDFPITALYPVIGEDVQNAGEVSGHYFQQDLYVAQKVFSRSPNKHIDVGSRIDGFVAHVASFRPITVFDIRPLAIDMPNIEFRQIDIMKAWELEPEITDSLSCLHALEHLGLGRYGDPLDPRGWEEGLKSLWKLLVKGGTLYLSVPTGEHQRIEFNAHRVFSIPYLRTYLEKMFVIRDVAFIDDSGDLITGFSLESPAARSSFSSHYGCSIWTLEKR